MFGFDRRNREREGERERETEGNCGNAMLLHPMRRGSGRISANQEAHSANSANSESSASATFFAGETFFDGTVVEGTEGRSSTMGVVTSVGT